MTRTKFDETTPPFFPLRENSRNASGTYAKRYSPRLFLSSFFYQTSTQHPNIDAGGGGDNLIFVRESSRIRPGESRDTRIRRYTCFLLERTSFFPSPSFIFSLVFPPVLSFLLLPSLLLLAPRQFFSRRSSSCPPFLLPPTAFEARKPKLNYQLDVARRHAFAR